MLAQGLTRTLINWAEGPGEDGPAFLSEQNRIMPAVRDAATRVSTENSQNHRVARLLRAISQQDSAGLACCFFAEHGAAGLLLNDSAEG